MLSKGMLILTRKKGESFLIGDSIRVTIVESNRRSLRIGIDAPREMNIVREELAPEDGRPRPSLALVLTRLRRRKVVINGWEAAARLGSAARSRQRLNRDIDLLLTTLG